MEITKKQFQAYEKVREGGKYNMFDPRARATAKLDEETYVAILGQYSELVKKYPDVMKIK